MAHAAFDTLKFVDTLEEAGIPELQARAMSVAVRKAYESSDVATKQDIADLRKDTKQDIDDLRRDMKQEIANVRYEIDDVRQTRVLAQRNQGSLFAPDHLARQRRFSSDQYRPPSSKTSTFKLSLFSHFISYENCTAPAWACDDRPFRL